MITYTLIHMQPDPPRLDFEVVAMYDFSPENMDELQLTEGEKLTVLEKPYDGWYIARNQQG